MSISREDYLNRYGGKDKWLEWIQGVDLPGDIKATATAGVIQEDEGAWKDWVSYNGRQLWKDRYNYDEDTWQGIAATMGLPGSRLSPQEHQQIQEDAESIRTHVTQEPMEMEDPIGWLETTRKFGRDISSLVQGNPDLHIAMVANDVLESTWSTVDALFPRSVRSLMNETFSIHLPYQNEGDKKFREAIGLTEQISIFP